MELPRKIDYPGKGIMDDKLDKEEKKILLELARKSLESAVKGESPPALEDFPLTARLRQEGASFVTLMVHGNLRGCIGALEPYQSLAEDVREHAAAAALEDYRFPKVQQQELKAIEIEISRLTIPTPLEYGNADELLEKIKPGIDGVVLRDAFRRATFLPQVWEKIPETADFLANLCMKMGNPPDAWRTRHLNVMIYHVEEFSE